ncbi:hypothetical protein B0H63DRAFT_297905 [Podospora didyma]|uniref:Uncharacterized protein n=1 Tax=Podospora didyma TaxID=330526 RepID=A0AAE0K9N7_9PEZI|nr:hypothetical protein B0H63DRAFT_297905 [Podospora didyma]
MDAHSIVTRQNRCLIDSNGDYVGDDCYVPFWYTRTGVIVKWSLFLILTTAIGLYLLLGYLHAKKRIRKGLPPLAYHRWLVSRGDLARVDPRYQYPQAAAYQYNGNLNNQQQYGMHSMPPPVYDPNSARPPQYEGPPPEGATKTNPSQWNSTAEPARGQQDEEYAPPSGPPPTTTTLAP